MQSARQESPLTRDVLATCAFAFVYQHLSALLAAAWDAAGPALAGISEGGVEISLLLRIDAPFFLASVVVGVIAGMLAALPMRYGPVLALAGLLLLLHAIPQILSPAAAGFRPVGWAAGGGAAVLSGAAYICISRIRERARG